MDIIQPTVKYKLSNRINYKTIGRYESRNNWVTKHTDFFIYADVKRMIEYCKNSVDHGWDLTFDQLFSHIISHEYIHFLIHTQIGSIETNCFDNIFGIVPHFPKYVYSGVKLEGDPFYKIPKRHFCTIELLSIVKTTICRFYTKLINTIKNIIGMVKK